MFLKFQNALELQRRTVQIFLVKISTHVDHRRTPSVIKFLLSETFLNSFQKTHPNHFPINKMILQFQKNNDDCTFKPIKNTNLLENTPEMAKTIIFRNFKTLQRRTVQECLVEISKEVDHYRSLRFFIHPFFTNHPFLVIHFSRVILFF